MLTKTECVRQLKLETHSLYRRYPHIVPNIRRRGNSKRTLLAFRNYHGWNTQHDMKCSECNKTDRCQIHHIDEDFRNCQIENLQSLCHLCHFTHKNGNVRHTNRKANIMSVENSITLTVPGYTVTITPLIKSNEVVKLYRGKGSRGDNWTDREINMLKIELQSSSNKSQVFKSVAKKLGRSTSAVSSYFYKVMQRQG